MSLWQKIPEFTGQTLMYAVYRKSVYFGLYDKSRLSDEELLELHIFNAEKEYRAIYSTFRKAFIEAVIDKDMTENIIDDRMMLYGTQSKFLPDNRLSRTENGKTQIFYFPEEIEKLEFEEPSKTVTEKVKDNDCLYVRNYYAFDKNNLLYLEGYRLLGITKGGKISDGKKEQEK